LTTKLSDTNILEQAQASVIRQATDEGFISDDTVAIDATHVEARDQAPIKKETQPKSAPKKRGRKSKDERDQWLKAEAEKAANLPLYEKPIAAQLDATLADLRDDVPQDPKWGIKKNSDFSGGQLNDGKAAIPLLKGLQERLSLPDLRYQTMDAGYDYTPIYTQVHQMGQQSVIAYNRRNEPAPDGFNKHFAPTCVREHAYRYDSFDSKYETLKYTQPKECKNCPLVNEGLCQKVWKIKITQDLRRYTAPARGSKAWKTIFKRRTSVERVNAYLKEYFQLNNVRYRTGQRAKVHFDTVTLIYNASKLAVDRINTQRNTQNVA